MKSDTAKVLLGDLPFSNLEVDRVKQDGCYGTSDETDRVRKLIICKS